MNRSKRAKRQTKWSNRRSGCTAGITAAVVVGVLACVALQVGMSLTVTPEHADPRGMLDSISAGGSRQQSANHQQDSVRERYGYGARPRVVLLDFEDDEAKKAGNTRLNQQKSSRSVQAIGGPCSYCLQEVDAHLKPFERPFQECNLMVDWQASFYPTCNFLHEIPIAQSQDSSPWSDVSLISTQGSWRNVWSLDDGAGRMAVVKLAKLERDFGHKAHQYSRVDAVAMEQLTKSPFVVDVFGFCGLSVVSEWAPTSSYSLIRQTRVGSPARLEIARDLARALSDVHSIDYPNSTNATLAHNDINGVNVVGVNGQIKLNDFNLATLMRWNDTRPCGMPVRFLVKTRKSPEENRNTTYVDPSLADVYALGNLLYLVMTSRDPWTTLEPNGTLLSDDEVHQRKIRGELPFIPPRFLQSNKITLQALYYATTACYREFPDRLNAHELAVGLSTACDYVERKANVTREAIKRLFARRAVP